MSTEYEAHTDLIEQDSQIHGASQRNKMRNKKCRSMVLLLVLSPAIQRLPAQIRNAPDPTQIITCMVAVTAFLLAILIFLVRERLEIITSQLHKQIMIMLGKSKAYLQILQGIEDGTPTTHQLFGRKITVGRSARVALTILPKDPTALSRHHCTIIERRTQFYIRDENSTNGTYLNRVQLSPGIEHPMLNGAEIELGQPHRGGIKMSFHLGIPKAESPRAEYRGYTPTLDMIDDGVTEPVEK